MKKFISVLLALALFAATLTGCVPTIDGAENPQDLESEQPQFSEEEEWAAEDPDATDADAQQTEPSSDDTPSLSDSSEMAMNSSNSESVSDDTSTEEEITTTEEETTVSEHVGLNALAQVQSFVNVRTGPSTGYNIVGKIYNNCAATIVDEVEAPDGLWYFITSGTVVGYIKAEFFVIGEEAQKRLSEVGLKKGIVTEESLRVRSSPNKDTTGNVFTQYAKGTEVVIEDITADGWAKINTDDDSVGYVFAEYLDISVQFKTAISLKEEQEEIERKRLAEERARKAQEEYERALAAQKAAAAEAARQASIAASIAAQKAYEEAIRKQQEQAAAAAAASAAAAAAAQQAAEEARRQAEQQAASATDSKTALRNAVVAYALQFVGNPYVHGGASLTNGTDCSGFTRLIYLKYGYTLSYTPERQQFEGVRFALDTSKSPESQLLPGDLIFFTSDVKPVGHVVMYIGNGKVVHAANEQLGIIISPAFYRQPLFAVRVIH